MFKIYDYYGNTTEITKYYYKYYFEYHIGTGKFIKRRIKNLRSEGDLFFIWVNPHLSARDAIRYSSESGTLIIKFSFIGSIPELAELFGFALENLSMNHHDRVLLGKFKEKYPESFI